MIFANPVTYPSCIEFASRIFQEVSLQDLKGKGIFARVQVSYKILAHSIAYKTHLAGACIFLEGMCKTFRLLQARIF